MALTDPHRAEIVDLGEEMHPPGAARIRHQQGKLQIGRDNQLAIDHLFLYLYPIAFSFPSLHVCWGNLFALK